MSSEQVKEWLSWPKLIVGALVSIGALLLILNFEIKTPQDISHATDEAVAAIRDTLREFIRTEPKRLEREMKPALDRQGRMDRKLDVLVYRAEVSACRQRNQGSGTAAEKIAAVTACEDSIPLP